MAERSVERIVRVYVPHELHDEFTSYNSEDTAVKYILGDAIRSVYDALLKNGYFKKGDVLKVLFVPDNKAPADSLERRIKYIELIKGETESDVRDAVVRRRILDTFPDRNN